MSLKFLAVIPARMASSRFPGKPLAIIKGKSMIRRVYERAAEAQGFSDIVVATDSREILQEIEAHGGSGVMTSPHCQTGLDRVLETASMKEYRDFTHFVNIQGDEPLIHSETIEGVMQTLIAPGGPPRGVATAAVPFQSQQHFLDPNRVKVVCSKDSRALYFSRSPIPHTRSDETQGFHNALKHLGIYGYSREALFSIQSLDTGVLEECEMLEQLRLLESGIDIYVHKTPHDSPGIDTPQDLQLLLSGNLLPE